MVHHGLPWFTMVYHGSPWFTMVYHSDLSRGKQTEQPRLVHLDRLQEVSEVRAEGQIFEVETALLVCEFSVALSPKNGGKGWETIEKMWGFTFHSVVFLAPMNFM